MKKYILAACLAAISSISAFAQTDDYKKGEVYVGYSNNQVDSGADSGDTVESFFDDRESFNGFEAAGVYNVSRYFGVKADVSGTYKNQNFSVPVATSPTTTITTNFDVKRSVYNFLGGVQVKDNSNDTRFKPFAHALIGAGHARYSVKNVTCAGTICPTFEDSGSETGLAGAFGGGLDIKATDKISIRAFQVDYNPIRINGDTSHNVRLGAGIVF
jgi:opacity protein-like surface antigen